MKKFAVPLFLFAFASLLGCQPKENKVKIALAVPLTGDIASLGQGIRRAVVMAVEEVNASGKLPYKIELMEMDDRSDPKEAVSVANRIVADRNVVAVIGHFNSGCSIPASRVYAGSSIPMLTPASSNPELTEQQLTPRWKWERNIFRVNTTDNVQGIYGANFLRNNLQIGKIGIIHDKTSYGQGVAEEFIKRFLEEGGQVTAFEGLQVGDRDFRALLTRIKATGPEALYFGGMFSEGGILLRQARDIGFKGPFLASEANLTQAFIDVAGDAAEGAYITFLGSPPDLVPSAKEFVERYKKRWPHDDIKSYDHYGYELVEIVSDALQKVGPDRKKIIQYIHTINFKGILGTTAFDEKGDTLNRTITLFQVRNGKFVPLVVKPRS